MTTILQLKVKHPYFSKSISIQLAELLCYWQNTVPDQFYLIAVCLLLGSSALMSPYLWCIVHREVFDWGDQSLCNQLPIGRWSFPTHKFCLKSCHLGLKCSGNRTTVGKKTEEKLQSVCPASSHFNAQTQSRGLQTSSKKANLYQGSVQNLIRMLKLIKGTTVNQITKPSLSLDSVVTAHFPIGQLTSIKALICSAYFWKIQHEALQQAHIMDRLGAYDKRQAPGSPFWLSPKGHNHSRTNIQSTGKERKFLKIVLIFVRFRSGRLHKRRVFSTDHRRVDISPTSENLNYFSLSLMQWVLLNIFHSIFWILC